MYFDMDANLQKAAKMQLGLRAALTADHSQGLNPMVRRALSSERDSKK
jgi:sulfur transfer protein SufE